MCDPVAKEINRNIKKSLLEIFCVTFFFECCYWNIKFYRMMFVIKRIQQHKTITETLLKWINGLSLQFSWQQKNKWHFLFGYCNKFMVFFSCIELYTLSLLLLCSNNESMPAETLFKWTFMYVLSFKTSTQTLLRSKNN